MKKWMVAVLLTLGVSVIALVVVGRWSQAKFVSTVLATLNDLEDTGQLSGHSSALSADGRWLISDYLVDSARNKDMTIEIVSTADPTKKVISPSNNVFGNVIERDSWSPDSRAIAYKVYDQGGKCRQKRILIYRFDEDGFGRAGIFDPGKGEDCFELTWSVDGSKLVVNAFYTIYILNQDAEVLVEISSTTLRHGIFNPWGTLLDGNTLFLIKDKHQGNPKVDRLLMIDLEHPDREPIILLEQDWGSLRLLGMNNNGQKLAVQVAEPGKPDQLWVLDWKKQVVEKTIDLNAIGDRISGNTISPNHIILNYQHNQEQHSLVFDWRGQTIREIEHKRFLEYNEGLGGVLVVDRTSEGTKYSIWAID